MRTVSLSLAVVLAGGMVTYGQDYYGGYAEYHSSTAAEGALRGMGDVARSAGQYNLQTSEAAINMTEAQKNHIQNRDEWTNTYFQMREANRQYRAAERKPRASIDDLVRYAQAGKPKPLSPSELDTVAGQISWPAVLKAEQFNHGRQALEELFLKRADQGGLSFDDQAAASRASDALMEQVKEGLRQKKVSQMDYVAAKQFIESLAVEAKRPVG